MPPPQTVSTSVPSGRQRKMPGGVAGQDRAVGPWDGVAVPAVGPVKAAIGPEDGAVDVGRVAGEPELA